MTPEEEMKKKLFYDPVPYGECEDEETEEPCDFGFSEDCVEPQLRDTNCCLECWLYTQVDEQVQKDAKELQEIDSGDSEAVSVEREKSREKQP